jgi:Peptidase S24-like
MASDLELLALRELPEVRGLLLASGVMRLRIASDSMRPTLRPGDEIAVQSEAIAALRPGDLIVYQVGGDLVCHRVVRSSADTVWTRAETADSADDRIAWDQVLGQVVEVRERGLWVGVKVLLRGALSPPVHRWLRRLQGLDAYRALLGPLVAPRLSYHLGLARGALRYEWRELAKHDGVPVLPPAARPHVLVGKWRETAVGWSVLVFRDSAWRCERVYVRLRYRGLGLESELSRLTDLLLEAR